MKKMILLTLCITINSTYAFKPRKVFKRKCSRCHTIGDGPSKGPDLKGVTNKYKKTWLITYLKKSSAMLNFDKQKKQRIHSYQNKNVDLSFFEASDLEIMLDYIYAKGASSNENIASGIGNIKAGRILATNCTTCHGITGHTGDISVPNIGGQHRAYLIKQLKAFKAGFREDPKGNMNDVTKKLTNRDLVNIATFYSSLK